MDWGKKEIAIAAVLFVIVLFVIYQMFFKSFSTSPSLTTRQLLDQKCPLSSSEIRNGVVYINPTNLATRDEYLFSACTTAGTCDSTTPDPISKRLIEGREHCGGWSLSTDPSKPDYAWDNTAKKWIRNRT